MQHNKFYHSHSFQERGVGVELSGWCCVAIEGEDSMNMHRNVVSCAWSDALWEASCTPSHRISSLRQYLKYSTPTTGNSLVPNVTGIAYTDTSDSDSKYRAPSSSSLFALRPAHKMNASTQAREEAEDTYPALTSFAKQVPIQGQPKRKVVLKVPVKMGVNVHCGGGGGERGGCAVGVGGKKGDELARAVLDFNWMRASLQARNPPRSLSSMPLPGSAVFYCLPPTYTTGTHPFHSIPGAAGTLCGSGDQATSVDRALIISPSFLPPSPTSTRRRLAL